MPAPLKRRRSLEDAIYTLPVEHEPDLVRLWALRLTYTFNGLERARRASRNRKRTRSGRSRRAWAENLAIPNLD
jgi:hypothetical protein